MLFALCAEIAGCAATPISVPALQCVPPAVTAIAPKPCLCAAAVLPAPKLEPPKQWFVLGTFPNPPFESPSATGAMRGGVDRDFLEMLGGEAVAVISHDTASRFKTSVDRVLVRVVSSDPTGFVDLNQSFPESSHRILYAYAELDSDREQQAYVHFGVDDSAKVWVNQKLVHNLFHPGRAATRWAEEFSVRLVKGKNRVLVKIDNGWKGAAFIFEPYTEAAHRAKVAELAEQRCAEEELVFADGGPFIRNDVTLPAVKWRNSALAEYALGTSVVTLAWYDAHGNPTNAATRTGLYTAVAAYRTKAGNPVHRVLPLLRTPPDLWQDLGWDKPVLPLPKHTSASDWTRLDRVVSGWAGNVLMSAPHWDASLPITLAEVISPENDAGIDLGSHAPLVRWQQTQLDLKRKILGLEETRRVGPTLRATRAPTLLPGTAEQAGIRPETMIDLRRIATEWAQADQQPFVLVLARHGIVFMHESFGRLDGRPLPLDYLFNPASIGKNFTALVFAQFVEQDLLRPAQLVGTVLPSWPKTGRSAVSFRQLFDHTAGLSGHTTYHGLDNPWLDEIFAAHVLPSTEAGVRFQYESDGGNIAAKAMELIDGRAFPILQREVLFGPLGARSIDQWDGGWAGLATALDMARVAQMLLQKGAYGDWQFFGEETWQELLPTRLADLYPNLSDPNIEWGIGIEHSWDPEDEATNQQVAGRRPPKQLHTVGHGAASSSIYRVDYRHDMVMVAGRIKAPNEKGYATSLRTMVRALEAGIMD